MSDKDDVVLGALETFHEFFRTAENMVEQDLSSLAEKAITIQKAQALVIDLAKKQPTLFVTTSLTEALAALDEVKKG